MFGHVRGAFTDAHRDRQGRFALADGGTILLDEIGELDLRSQVKMLRVLQDRTYEVLGSSETRTLDVRVISRHQPRPAGRPSRRGAFREDLLYRLNLITVHLPSLAERRDDIPLLARHFLEAAAADLRRRAGRHQRIRALRLAARRRSGPATSASCKHLIERTLLVTGADVLQPEHFQATAAMDRTERRTRAAEGRAACRWAA